MTELIDVKDVCECGHSESIHAKNGICFGKDCWCAKFTPKHPERHRDYANELLRRFREELKPSDLKRGSKR